MEVPIRSRKAYKTKVFKSVVKAHFDLYSGSNDNIYTIISIGDSDDEYTASHEAKQMITTMNRLNRNNNIVRCHRIKLKNQPTIKVMLKQIALLMVDAEMLKTERGSMSIQYGQEMDVKKADTKRSWKNPLCCSNPIPGPICPPQVLPPFPVGM